MSIKSRRGFAIAAVTLLALLVVVMPGPVSAQKSLECQMVWEGPSIDNSLVSCLTNKDRLIDQWRYYVFPGLSALLFVVILVSFPIVFMCVTCCHCSSCCKPENAEITANSRCFLWMWIAFAVLWSCGVVVLVIFGTNLLAVSVPALFNDTLNGPLKYFNDTAERIVDFTSNWSTGTREPLDGIDLDLSAFNNLSSTVAGSLTDIRDDISKHLNWAPIVSYSVGAAGTALMFFMVFLACCRCCIPCLPLCFSCVYWIFGIVYSLLGVLTILLAYFASVGCGEVELQYQREPGVFQWFLVPYCNEKFDFQAINKNVRAHEKKLSEEACTELLKVCDDTPVAVPRPLTCGKGITTGDQCPDMGTVAEVFEATTVKAATNACPVPTESCTLAECAKGCTVDDVRTVAAGLLETSGLARNASIAVSYARPLLECNFVVDELLGALNSCNNLYAGSLMLGVGFFVGGLMFGLGIYIMLRGSCVWRSSKQ